MRGMALFGSMADCVDEIPITNTAVVGGERSGFVIEPHECVTQLVVVDDQMAALTTVATIQVSVRYDGMFAAGEVVLDIISDGFVHFMVVKWPTERASVRIGFSSADRQNFLRTGGTLTLVFDPAKPILEFP